MGATTNLAEAERHDAIALARAACSTLSLLGVEARIAGSLARGTYARGSDIDILVLRCPLERKYAIEGTVEDVLRGHPFDLIYLDEVPPSRSRGLLEEAVDAGQLR
jgi:predicted nucleotidyltransferase